MNYNKENICSFCDGTKGWTFIHDNDPSRGPVFHPCYCEDGTRVGQLISDLAIQKLQNEQIYDDYNQLRQWVEKTSTCKTCKGDQYSIPGGTLCSECRLPGLQPWGG
jgi:hypothetical protein